LNEETKKSLLLWQPVSNKIITARFNSKSKKILFVQCYAPTKVSLLEEKQHFYEQLNKILYQFPKNDMNAKIGSDNINLETVREKHGLGEMNNNEELLTNFCANHNLPT